MYKRATLDLPLHYGRCPRWLFSKMKRLARAVTECIIYENGPGLFLEKLSDPYFFQSFGCVLAFDWHSSGLTTTVCGAVKEALKGTEKDLRVYAAGGKGKASRKTPKEIEAACEALAIDPKRFVYASRMGAKVDSACVQDGYGLYQHTFFFTPDGQWSIIQQGMNPDTRYARRYHWFSNGVKDFVCEPHTAVCCDKRQSSLNMVAAESAGCREASAYISRQKPALAIKQIGRFKEKALPARHQVSAGDIDPKRLNSILLKTYEKCPDDFESLVITEGVGAKTIRALSLVSELIYGKAPSFKDPARFSYAHGGKDGYPYPVDRRNYESSIKILEKAVESAKIGRTEKIEALRHLPAHI